MEIEYKHGFAHQEAKARARALADYLSAKHGMQVAWRSDDDFKVTGKYKVVQIDLSVAVLPDRVQIAGKDPGMLWRAPAKAYISRKLEQYMDPSAQLDALPRA